MSSFEDTLARMKGLYTYGKEVNESNNVNTHSIEHAAVAANGITYGIIRENSKYYIKSAPKGKEAIAEAYDYLGGFCNKKNYEYDSYNAALKNFEMKLASINEACDQKVNVESLNPFRANGVLAEATEAMKNEIARQRQIMYNTAMLMEESSEIGADRKDDVVKYDGKNPEAETGKKGDEGNTAAKANPEYAGSKTNGVDKKVAPFDQGEGNPKDQLKEEASDIGDAPLHPNTENWGTEGIGKGREPEQVGWDIEGQQKVNEEEEDWASKGLPSSAGVGEADTDHNNMPFNKGLNEEEDFDGEDSGVEDVDLGVEDDADADGAEASDGAEDFENDFESDLDDEGEDLSTDTDFDAGVEDVDDDDEALADDEDLSGEDDSDLMAQIENLQAQLDALRAKLDGGESEDLGAEDDLSAEDDLGTDDSADELDAEAGEGEGEDFEAGDEPEFGDGEDETGMDLSSDDTFDGGEDEDTLGDDDDLDECGMGGDAAMPQDEPMMESKKKVMDRIVESVVKQIMAEDELHVFGKHPGYRKKPMELPTTGEDKNQWGEDWNDESVHNEEPFGSKIGDGTPFNQLVDAITKDVMYQLKAGIPIEGENKKKE